MNFIEHSYLCHYGIKGMKWGIRRYQNKDGSLTAAGKKRYRKLKSGMSMFAGMGSIGDNREYSQDVFAEALPDQNQQWRWTTDFRNLVFNQEHIDNPENVFDDVVGKINNYGEENGTTNNCTKCASAMVLAKQGYDFDAGRSNRGYTNAIEQWFNNTDKRLYDNLNGSLEDISNTATGDYGMIDMRNENGGGHIFNWEHKSDGSFGVYDGQVGKSFTGNSIEECMDQYLEEFPYFDRNDTVVTRNMTNSEPKWDNMGEDSVVRIRKYGGGLIQQKLIDPNDTSKPWLTREAVDYNTSHGKVYSKLG